MEHLGGLFDERLFGERTLVVEYLIHCVGVFLGSDLLRLPVGFGTEIDVILGWKLLAPIETVLAFHCTETVDVQHQVVKQ